MGKSLRKTGLVWIALLLPVWGWASSAELTGREPVFQVKIQDRHESRSQKRQDDRRKQKTKERQKADQKRKQDTKSGPEQKPKQDPKRVQRPDDRKRPNEDVGRQGEKPQIKEVPKSIHKLKPKSVTEKVRIRRPPVKVKPKGRFRVY
ncbi:MAG TPA: hypothetical protein VGE15_11585 [Sphingobacteriaceae bacterium]